jgi:hypothetical protein
MRTIAMGRGCLVIVVWAMATISLLQPLGQADAQGQPFPSKLDRPNESKPGSADSSLGHVHDDLHDHSDAVSLPPLGFSLTEGWLDPWPHRHFSRRGTPFAHTFFTEPAFLDRDFFLDARISRGEDGNEVELEAEVEWALTRRIGVVFEVPFLFLDPEDGGTEEGFGDFAFAPRFLLVETNRFLLSANLEVETPTGSENRGLGRGETTLSPTLSLWYDLGKFVALNAQFGTEHGLESGEDEFLYNTALAFSLLDSERGAGEGNKHGQHFPAGLVNLLAEVTGRTGLSGEEHGRTTAEFLFGASYMATSYVEIRSGLQFPLFKPREFDNAYLLSLVYHF